MLKEYTFFHSSRRKIALILQVPTLLNGQTQTIRRKFLTAFDHFVGLTIKVLRFT